MTCKIFKNNSSIFYDQQEGTKPFPVAFIKNTNVYGFILFRFHFVFRHRFLVKFSSNLTFRFICHFGKEDWNLALKPSRFGYR